VARGTTGTPPLGPAIAAVRERIAAAARSVGRRPEDVLLVGASKTVPAARLREALRAGLHHFGENRAQELVSKAADLAGAHPAPVWHFVGRLQRNKVRALAGHVTWWHSVDRVELGPELARWAAGARVLVEVNVAGEASKGGCSPAELPGLVEVLATSGLEVVGLMTIPPRHEDPRPYFARLRALGERLGLRELSMGMSDDFEAAVAEGATIVRVGRAIFGERPVAGAGGHPPGGAPPLS